MTLRPREFCRFLLLFVSLGSGVGWAAPPAPPPAPPPAKAEASAAGDAAELRARVERARARTDVTPAERSLVLEQLDSAQARLDSAAAAEKKAAEYLEILRTAPDTIAALSEQSAQAPPTPVDTHANVDLVEAQLELASLQAKAVSLRGQQRALEESLQTMSTRQAPAHEELAEMRRDLDEPQPAVPSNASTVLLEASRLRAESIRRDLSARIEMTEQELLTLPIRETMASARRDLTARQLQATEAAILALQANLGGRREEAAARRSQEARDEAQRLVDGPPAVRSFATHTAELRASAATFDEKIEANRLAQVGLLARRNEIAEARRNAEQVLATGQIGNQHARMLRGFGKDLPTQDALRRRMAHREREIVDCRLQRIQLQQELHELDDIDAAARAALTSAGVAPSPEWIAAMTRLVESRRAALLDLQALRTRQIDGLAEANAGDAELLDSTTQLRTLLDQRLLWLPSGTPLDGAWLRQLHRGWSWMSARDSWAQVPAGLGASLFAHPLAAVLVVALLVALVAARRPMKRALEHSATAVGTRHDRFSSTVLALVFALLHALPWPLAFAATGLALDSAESTGAFANTLGMGLLGAAVVLYMVGVFEAMCAPHGLFVAHFRWEPTGTKRLDRALRSLELVLVPTTAMVAMANADNSALHPEGWGRLGLMVGAVALAVVPLRLLGPRHGIFMSALSRTGLLWRARYVWFAVLVAVPLLLAALAAAGYQATASDLQARLFTSGWSVLAVVIAYRIAMRGVLVAGRRAAFAQADARRTKARLARESIDGAASMRSEETALDVVSVSLQTRSLLRAAAAVVLAALSWSIWKAIVPALEVLNDVALWSRPGAEGAVTLADAGLSALTLGLTWIAARNLPGFLEIALLQQLRIEAGTRYAITTIARYAIVAVGMIIVLRWVGADWSKLQWLLAALSVGLGFGLQEIVANFVSGIIILFERPVRVGDTISIGSTLGTVSRIQIRAITLLDPDNLEVVVPNKSFITQSVQNWSLSSSITRIVVKVGVGYGCDPLEARRILLDVATANPNVLATPAPSALFLGFGDSALQFELRAFVGAIDQRLSTLDALHAAVHRALGAAGIEIPFPQRDVYVHGAAAPEEAPAESAPVVDAAP